MLDGMVVRRNQFAAFPHVGRRMVTVTVIPETIGMPAGTSVIRMRTGTRSLAVQPVLRFKGRAIFVPLIWRETSRRSCVTLTAKARAAGNAAQRAGARRGHRNLPTP